MLAGQPPALPPTTHVQEEMVPNSLSNPEVPRGHLEDKEDP